MKVYLGDKELPVSSITWAELCKPGIFVDHEKDTHVKWPDHINEAAISAFAKIYKWAELRSQPIHRRAWNWIKSLVYTQ